MKKKLDVKLNLGGTQRNLLKYVSVRKEKSKRFKEDNPVEEADL